MGKEIQKVNPDRKRQRFTKEFKVERKLKGPGSIFSREQPDPATNLE
jgi:hypothetical protein